MDQFSAIRAFMRIVETGSLSKAAMSLEMPKSTVSKLLADLESYLGAKLLQRSTRSVALTVEGATYYEHVGQVMLSLQDADLSVRESSATPRGRVRIDVPSSLANTLVIPALTEFRALYPDIQLVIGISDRPVALIEEAVDCVLRVGHLPDTSLIAKTIYEDRLVTCASPAYLASRGLPVTPEELRQGHEIIGYFSALTGEARPLLFKNGNKIVEISDANLLSNDSTGQRSMILSGLGIGQQFRSTVISHLKTGALVSVLDDWTDYTAPISILYPSSKKLTLRVRVFIDWLTDRLRRSYNDDQI
ncbi:LysR family transcriptional regulator [Rhizobiales bacterium RZME27]|uniref:LysR family transcriptional regulator n=1 Tax=Endobacterium cereale TaxID=2663029 RepID=A0A6A8A910_9HYPH|nr:LysR family transcriptional regulator [Endobacterium cereale]MEB2847774.1 LysR family transcriptional regulator [Endobacterium cereale]MQY47765.1 LysR family transcriptional regulator [Endobacterium cereale]